MAEGVIITESKTGMATTTGPPIPSVKSFKGKQLLTFSNVEELNIVWLKVKQYRKDRKINTMGDAVLELLKKALA